MAELKRDLVKYVRDKAKSSYNKGTECYICGSTSDLEFHHFHTLTILLNTWLALHKLDISTAEEIFDIRDRFILEHKSQIFEETVTLCKLHHKDRLHKIYGKAPPLITAKKQKKWCDIRRNKEYNK